ncbi:unnamed protein product, partial [Polarella glacialis]
MAPVPSRPATLRQDVARSTGPTFFALADERKPIAWQAYSMEQVLMVDGHIVCVVVIIVDVVPWFILLLYCCLIPLLFVFVCCCVVGGGVVDDGCTVFCFCSLILLTTWVFINSHFIIKTATVTMNTNKQETRVGFVACFICCCCSCCSR